MSQNLKQSESLVITCLMVVTRISMTAMLAFPVEEEPLCSKTNSKLPITIKN